MLGLIKQVSCINEQLVKIFLNDVVSGLVTGEEVVWHDQYFGAKGPLRSGDDTQQPVQMFFTIAKQTCLKELNINPVWFECALCRQRR